MRILRELNSPGRGGGLCRRRQAGLTLTETMVASAVFSLAVIGLLACHMFGLRLDQLANSKVGASELARLSFNQLSDDIRSAKRWEIGNGDESSFVEIPLGQNQKGTALKLYSTSFTNSYCLYYFDTNQYELLRYNSTSGEAKCVAKYLTNTMFFQMQDFQGINQTNLTHKGVVNVVMQFCQFQYPITMIGPGYYYDYYRIDLRVTPHAPDGP